MSRRTLGGVSGCRGDSVNLPCCCFPKLDVLTSRGSPAIALPTETLTIHQQATTHAITLLLRSDNDIRQEKSSIAVKASYSPRRELKSSKMAAEDTGKRLEEAKKLSKEQPEKAEQIYKDILSKPPGSNDKQSREFEQALMGVGELYRDHKRADDLASLIQQTRDVLTSFARAKTSKLGTFSVPQ